MICNFFQIILEVLPFITLIFLPFAGSIICVFRILPKFVVAFSRNMGFFISIDYLYVCVAVLFMLISAILISSIFILYIYRGFGNYEIVILSWIHEHVLEVDYGIIVDPLTIVMLFTVVVVSLLVHTYSLDYMSHDPNMTCFVGYLSFFTFSMLVLVSAPNFLQLFLGWEGVGLASYLLINFWYTRREANLAAFKAMVTNRFADSFLLGCICILFLNTYSLNFSSVFFCFVGTEWTCTVYDFVLDLSLFAGFLLFFGAAGKSAQLGFHVWLPDAMEGPTPVSALIHAATMVTAGIFLLARCSPILEYSGYITNFMIIVGVLTALFGSFVAVFQMDVKKIIAYSTCSQLGYMVMACGMSNYTAAIFHLVNHAFFKALLFLSVGSLIHGLFGEQDIRKMGGLIKILPITYLFIFIGSCSLSGIPFLAGYYSKDIIIDGCCQLSVNYALCVYALLLISAGFTAVYSTRILTLSFLSFNNNNLRSIISHVTEMSYFALISCTVLSLGSITSGYIFRDLFVGFGSCFWSNSIFVNQLATSMLDFEFLKNDLKILVFLILIDFLYVFYLLVFDFYLTIVFLILRTYSLLRVYVFFCNVWLFDIVYTGFIIKFISNLGYKINFKYGDRGLLEIFGSFGLVQFFFYVSRVITGMQSGYLYSYVTSTVVQLFVFLILVTFI